VSATQGNLQRSRGLSRGLIVLVLVGLCSCDRSPKASSASEQNVEPIRTVASVYALGDLARQVGGKYVQVESIVESGQSLNGFWPTLQMRDRLNRAELIIAGGSMTETWAVSDSSNPYAPERVMRLDALATATTKPSVERLGISEAGLLWLDPVIVQQAADELADRLNAKRPGHEMFFRHQAETLKAQVQQLVDRYAALIAKLPENQRRVVALSGEFDPLAARLGIQVIHIVDEPAERLGEDHIRLLRDTNRELTSGGQSPPLCLLVRADTPTALLQDLALRTGMRMVPLDPYGSSANADRDTLVELLKYNLQELAQGLGAEKQ
jgi:ABC-type Zn uptake system ZnuABC Zn-binding protein ZnuA